MDDSRTHARVPSESQRIGVLADLEARSSPQDMSESDRRLVLDVLERSSESSVPSREKRIQVLESIQ